MNDKSIKESNNETVVGLKPEEELSVQIISGYKSYGSYNVLKNLNLNVPKGAIYGLLGPSGCGKTTILKSVVGRLSLDSGIVNVLGKEPGTRGHEIPGSLVGYMPQEISLYKEFNIHETLNYFGILHGMKLEKIRERKNFLIEFLNLPKNSRLIKNLSGGQKRRVSMAVALLQEPRLLILDEPTVGVDPLLREKIWNHLLDISKTSLTTIIITTHYIEEARKADRVGLMRNGKILAENNPEYLLQLYNETTLENVFLRLCIEDQEPIQNHTNIPINIVPNTTILPSTTESSYSNQPLEVIPKGRSLINRTMRNLKKSMRLPHLNNYKGLVYKDSILIRRNIGFLFFQIFIPILQISLFCLCIGQEPFNIKFGIVNNETIYNSSKQFGSEIFISELNNRTFDKVYMNWSDAYKETKKGELWGFIDLSENFTESTLDRFNPFADPNSTFVGANINVYLDSSTQQISVVASTRIAEAYQGFLKKMFAYFPIQINPNLLNSPIIENAIYGDINPQFINFMAPGIMVTIIFVLTIGLTALMFVIEKKEGLLERTVVAGVNTSELILAHFTVKLMIMIFQTLVLLLISSLVFNVNMKGSIVLAGVLLMLQGFCGMSFGLAISSLCRDENEATQVAIGSVFPAMLLSGILWPVEGMPNWVRFLSNFSPISHNAEAIRSVASRGWGLDSFTIWFGIITVLAWSLVFNLIAMIFFNSEE